MHGTLTGNSCVDLRMSERRPNRLSRRSFLAATGAGSIAGVGGCLGTATEGSDDERPPADWFDVEHWTGTYTYVRRWEQRHPSWTGEEPSFEFTMRGVFDFEYRSQTENTISYRSVAPASWTIAGGGSWEGTHDSWQATFTDTGTYWPQYNLNFRLYFDRYGLTRNHRHLPITVPVEGSKSAETTGWYESQYSSTAGYIADMGASGEIPDEVGPLEGEQEWTDEIPNAHQVRSISWDLSPGPLEADEPDDHPCDDTDIREGLETAAAESLREGVAAGFEDAGVSLGPEQVAVVQPGVGDDLRYSIRLGYDDNRPRHTGACIVDAVARGALPPGVEEGSAHLVVGMLQQVDGRTRLSMRVVDVETGEVVAAGTGEAAGTDGAAIGDATSDAVGELEGFEFR